MSEWSLSQYAALKAIETNKGKARYPITIDQIPGDLKKWIRDQSELNGEMYTLTNEGKVTIIEEGSQVFYKITDEGKKFIKDTEEKLKEIEKVNRETENKLQILKNPTLLYYIKQVLDRSIVGEDKNKLLLFLLGLSSRLGSKEAQACYLIGPASSGKSYITHQTLTLLTDFVEEDGKLIWLTRSSTHGLEYYLNNYYTLDGFILFVEEAPGFGEAQASVRPMFSEKGLKIVIATGGNPPDVKELSVNGCPAFFTTSTTPIREEQMASRVWILQTDESEEHTKEVLEFTKKKVSTLDIEKQIEIERQKVKAALKLLRKPDGVLIPYAEAIEFPTSQVRARRDFNKLSALIKVSAYLHQYKRPWVEYKGKKYILATFADYYIAYTLMHDLLKPIMYGLSENVLRLLEICKQIKEDDDQDITVKRVTLETNYSQRTVRAYLDALVDAGLLVKEKEGRENHYYLRSERKFIELTPIDEIVKKFKAQDFEDWQSKNFNQIIVGYDKLLEGIYDPLSGRIPVYRIDKIESNSVKSGNTESNSVMPFNTESYSVSTTRQNGNESESIKGVSER